MKTQNQPKKTLRVVTFIFCEENYGHVLQAYALQRYLLNHYANVYDIKVIYGVPATFGKKKYLIYRIFGGGIYRLLWRGKKLLQALRGSVDTHSARTLAIKRRDFNTFKFAHIALDNDTLQCYPVCTKIHYPQLEADIYITGSDQLWNDWNSAPEETLEGYEYSWLPYYTLEFAKPSSVKISYAASMGKRDFKNAAQRAYFQKALQGFRAISLREQAGVDMLKSIGIESVCVPDPTMLLTKQQWEKLIDSAKLDLPQNLQESIFIYGYGDEKFGGYELPKLLQPYGNVIAVTQGYHPSANYEPTLQEWVACIKHSRLVVCRSFHGACFAIMMNTPFFLCKISAAETESLNTRFENLIRVFGLEDRVVSDLQALQQKIVENPPIDWECVNARLAEWRKVGEDFLAQALKEA